MIARHPFGRTGHLSSRAILGAAAFWRVTQREADIAMDLALARGVNHVDVAASYGEAEARLGDWIHRHGRPFFLATKTGERTAAGAREEIRRSLERLRVDQVDLLQLHNLAAPGEWDTTMGPGGALEAAVEARDQGLARFIGVTGHGLSIAAMHLKSLDRFDFDSVLLPCSFVLAQNESYRRDFLAVWDRCRDRNVAVQTIKSIVRSPWDGEPQTRSTWYRPLEDQADIDRAVHWVLGHPGLFLNTVGDVDLLPRVLDAVDRFEAPPSGEEMRTLVARRAMRPLFV